jgi:hypothetical protein
MTQPIDDVHNNGVHNNGDGVDSECDVHSTLPLCQPNCLAATPTSPMRVGSSRRVTANPTAYQLVDPTTHHISDTTQPALKKQRLVICPEGSPWFLLGGDDIFSNNEAATSFDKNPTTLGDLLVLNALDGPSLSLQPACLGPNYVLRLMRLGACGMCAARDGACAVRMRCACAVCSCCVYVYVWVGVQPACALAGPTLSLS